jgi:hypothetical protein
MTGVVDALAVSIRREANRKDGETTRTIDVTD